MKLLTWNLYIRVSKLLKNLHFLNFVYAIIFSHGAKQIVWKRTKTTRAKKILKHLINFTKHVSQTLDTRYFMFSWKTCFSSSITIVANLLTLLSPKEFFLGRILNSLTKFQFHSFFFSSSFIYIYSIGTELFQRNICRSMNFMYLISYNKLWIWSLFTSKIK